MNKPGHSPVKAFSPPHKPEQHQQNMKQHGSYITKCTHIHNKNNDLTIVTRH